MPSRKRGCHEMATGPRAPPAADVAVVDVKSAPTRPDNGPPLGTGVQRCATPLRVRSCSSQCGSSLAKRARLHQEPATAEHLGQAPVSRASLSTLPGSVVSHIFGMVPPTIFGLVGFMRKGDINRTAYKSALRKLVPKVEPAKICFNDLMIQKWTGDRFSGLLKRDEQVKQLLVLRSDPRVQQLLIQLDHELQSIYFARR